MINGSDIIGYLKRDFGMEPMQRLVADQVYACPDEQWFFSEFKSELYLHLEEHDLLDWSEEEGDCDDFALQGVALARRMHRLTERENRKLSIAIGQFWYYRNADPIDEHANIIALICRGPARYEPVWMDRRKDAVGQVHLFQSNLTADERKSWSGFYI